MLTAVFFPADHLPESVDLQEIALRAWRAGLSFLDLSFERAMAIKPIRISLECAISNSTKTMGKPAPIQPALI